VSREYDTIPPVINDIEDYAITCNADWPEPLTTPWTDNCAVGGDIESDEGFADGEEDCIQFRLYTFTVTDNCGNTTTETTRVSREYDTIPPVINDIEDYAIACNADWPEPLTTSWTDNCAVGGDIISDEGVADGEEDCTQFRLYTFTVSDNCGNTTTETTRVSREYDTIPPEIVDVEDYLIDANDVWPEFLTTQWTDNCASGGSLDSDEGIDDEEVDCVQFRIYTFTINDNCGNTATETTKISRNISSSPESMNGNKCIIEDDNFDLFDYLIGDYDTNGEWVVTVGNLNLNGSLFNPSSLLDEEGNYEESQLGDYKFTYKIGGDCPSETEVVITIHDECIVLCDFDESNITTALTPNGDGQNDFFYGGLSQELRQYGCTIQVQIFNRWGAIIYDSKDYQNNWKGNVQSNAIGSSGSITTGTYYYIIKQEVDGALLKTIKGYFYVATE
jgi:gliding motility-associated-like protein